MNSNGLCNRSTYEASMFLHSNSTLSLLDLSENMIGSLGIAFLLKAMQHNHSLRVPNVSNNTNFFIKYSKDVTGLIKTRICSANACQELYVHGISLHVNTHDLTMFKALLPRTLRNHGMRPTNYDITVLWKQHYSVCKVTFAQVLHPRLSYGVWRGLSSDLMHCIATFCII